MPSHHRLLAESGRISSVPPYIDFAHGYLTAPYRITTGTAIQHIYQQSRLPGSKIEMENIDKGISESIASDHQERKDVHSIHLKHDTNVPKSSDILPSWDMKDKDDSISSTEKH